MPDVLTLTSAACLTHTFKTPPAKGVHLATPCLEDAQTRSGPVTLTRDLGQTRTCP